MYFSFYLVLLILKHIFCNGFQEQMSEITPQSVNFNDLLTLDASIAHVVANALVTVGILQVVGIPTFKESRLRALGDIGNCFQVNKSHTVTRKLRDGTIRMTSAASSQRGQASRMSSSCAHSSGPLRASIDATVRQLFLSLDSIIHESEMPLLQPYNKFLDIVDQGEHLEHMHVYYGASTDDILDGTVKQSESDNAHKSSVDSENSFLFVPKSVDMHTDGGLFIAMTAGLYSEQVKDNKIRGLYITMPTGAVLKLNQSDDALIIMVGEAGGRWLSPVLGAPLRPCPHALIAPLQSRCLPSGKPNTSNRVLAQS